MQAPRLRLEPNYVSSAGDEAVALARMAGLELDEWQQAVLRASLGEKPDGKWSAFEVGLCVARQNGKNPHALDTPILTTDGWTMIGDIQPGQEVYGADGQPTRVVGCSEVFNEERCYEVEFTDSSAYVVGSGHLWRVRHRERREWEVVDTATLAESVGGRRPDNGRMEFNWRVRCDAVPQTPEADLPIDPYFFGMWLGDGSSSAPVITAGSEDRAFVCDQIRRAGLEVVSEARGNSEWRPWHLTFRLGKRYSRDGFLPRIRKLGVYGDKHIPECYLNASPHQRLELLRGLMDTDGSIACTNRSPQVEFSSSCERLAADFHRLARSLGIRVTPKSRMTTHKDNWRFLWTPTFNPFRLPRKAELFRPPTSRRHEVMSVTAVRPVATVPTRCIQVEARDGVYLVGRTFTPTHNSILEARELAGLFLLGERLIVHSAHEFDTSMEHFLRIRDLIEGTPELDKRVAAIRTANGKEGIELTSGQRLRFRARTKGGGRGWSADLVVFDEAMEIKQASHGSILPTLSARSNPQVWYTGSAVDEWIHDHGLVFAKVRERGIQGDEGLAYFEWSADIGDPAKDDPEAALEIATDEEAWRQANPALGIRIATEHIAAEQRSMDPRTFAVERLGVGAWPSTDAEGDQVIPPEAWRALEDIGSEPRDPVCIAFDVTPDRSASAIAVAGLREDGNVHVELVDPDRDDETASRKGTRWLIPRLAELVADHSPAIVACDPAGPAGSFIDRLEAKGIEIEEVSMREYGQACGAIYDACEDGTLRHLGQPELNYAVAGAAKRALGEAWAWRRKGSATDISPLVAATLAHFYAQQERESVYEGRGVLSFG